MSELNRSRIIELENENKNIKSVLKDFFGTLKIAFDKNRKIIPTPDWISISKHALKQLDGEKKEVR